MPKMDILKAPIHQQTRETKLSFDDTSVAFANQSDWQLKKTYFIFAAMNRNWLVKIGTFFIKLFLMLKFPIKGAIKNTIFEHFCGGETIEGCTHTIQQLDKAHIGTILDYSVEGEDSEQSFDETVKEILRTIEKAAQMPAIPFSVFKVTGIASTELLEKAQSTQGLNETETAAFARVRERMDLLCKAAFEHHVRIFVDAEETWIQDTIDRLTYEMMERYNRKECIVWNTYQMYRVESYANLVQATETAVAKGYELGVKLVRGAYMEKERQRAHEMEYADPIHATKEATDQAYNQAVLYFLENRNVISICLGTHNEYSCLLMAEKMKEAGIPVNDAHIWFAQLLGMSDNISFNLAHSGYNVAKYVPYGPVEAVMPYLFRRAEENTSVAGQASREFTLLKKEARRRKRAVRQQLCKSKKTAQQA
ncbi:proline dehydrogenase family protein [Siphonobacter sp. BAB-5405]|uniref:proline dehydrogenase family protein n=1 Tax=Siphonobacter sp. BAB-5405 TaxID=1864825 RepID=UPI001E3FEB8B|nr:proline dehydrogenase family protein [Siphonobacter sp. BAB-5405]